MINDTDAVRWVHIDKKNEPDFKVHLMIGDEEESLNLTMCASDAGFEPRDVPVNSTTAGDLCRDCFEGFLLSCGARVSWR